MTHKIRVNVNQRDIERGIRRSAGSCPVARALQRHEEMGPMWVGAQSIRLRRQPVSPDYTIELPGAVAAFVAAFDEGRPVAPFSFDLEVPE